LNQKRKIFLITVLLLLVNFMPGAQESSVTLFDKLTPVNVRITNDLSSGKEFENAEKTISSFLHKWSIEGASIAISKDGKLVFAKGFGLADTLSGFQVQPYNQFRIASISKLITAIAIMKLKEDGKLSLNDKVFGTDGILNDSCFSSPKDKRVYSMTVAQLLGHKGGWSQLYGDQMFMPVLIAEKMKMQPPVDTKTIVRFALNRNLQYTPGEGRAYSNIGYAVLGLIVEKVSGMTYEDYCQTAVLQPLGIYDMKIAKNLKEERYPLEVTYYEPADVLLKPFIYNPKEMAQPAYGGNDITALGGAGGWIATAPDLMKLLLAVDGFNSRPDFLSGESISFMTDNENGYAPVGWKGTIIDGTWYRTGSFPGSAGMMKRQSDGISWVVLFNTSAWNGPDIYSYISNMMYRVIARIDPMPDNDLFQYSLPVPLNISLSDYSVK
jgi:CubicO group peptidase (beta-lactamase class C family)